MNNLNFYRDPSTEVSVYVCKWVYSIPVRGQYIEHPRSIWLIWNYIRKVGIRSVIQKLRSRFSEIPRNKKVCGMGLARVIESPTSMQLAPDSQVLFFAPNHNISSEVLCLHESFIFPISKKDENSIHKDCLPCQNGLPELLESYAGWSPYSGIPVDMDAIRSELAAICLTLKKNEMDNDVSPDNPLIENRDQINREPIKSNKPGAVLFGLGNYAKTAIIPNIGKYLTLQRVHEVDPDQLSFFDKDSAISLDTSPHYRSDLKFDAWLIAGFHHTHTDLAIAAIEQSAYAVIEKPLATTMDQYKKFFAAVNKKNTPRFFLCFHKRYSELHKQAMHDLSLEPGEPVDMHCIVYEIPLPDKHWYNWPNSGSRLISNGCHWIDYFMFVNDFSLPVDYHVWYPRGADVSVQLRLENGAYMVMSLTDTGSQRLGVRDYIELRRKGITVKMTDATHYSAENRTRVFRKEKVNPGKVYAKMYKQIGKAIAEGLPGDDLKTLRSSEITLLLEEIGKKSRT